MLKVGDIVLVFCVSLDRCHEEEFGFNDRVADGGAETRVFTHFKMCF